jgi:hypothetical protein
MKMKTVKIISRTKELTKEKGVRYVISLIIRYFEYYYYKIFNSLRTFTFNGKKFKYFSHRYNGAWRIERTVEVPIIRDIMKKYHGKNILEVGNVLSHYFSVNHDVLDKYEKACRVINRDVVNFRPSKKYDLIVSISTLEHVGWDEKPRQPMKILRAVENLKKLLVAGGKIVITLPLSYNTNVNKIKFTEKYYLKRISRDNKWFESDWEGVKCVKYNEPFPCANAVIIGVIK